MLKYLQKLLKLLHQIVNCNSSHVYYSHVWTWCHVGLYTCITYKHMWYSLRWCIQQEVERREEPMHTLQAFYAAHFISQKYIPEIKAWDFDKDWEMNPIKAFSSSSLAITFNSSLFHNDWHGGRSTKHVFDLPEHRTLISCPYSFVISAQTSQRSI